LPKRSPPETVPVSECDTPYDKAPQSMRLHFARKASTEELDCSNGTGNAPHTNTLILVHFPAPISQKGQFHGRATMTLQAEQGIGQFVVRQTGRKANSC
jgi:hypothetical protein